MNKKKLAAQEAAVRMLNIMKSQSKSNPATVCSLVWGTVTSIDPLAIQIDGKTTITEQFIILHSCCKESIIKIPTEEIVKHLHVVPLHTTDTGGSQDPHTHNVQPFNTLMAMPEIRLWRGLEVGDNVRMLRINEGQLYYVLERDEGIPWYDVTAIADHT